MRRAIPLAFVLCALPARPARATTVTLNDFSNTSALTLSGSAQNLQTAEGWVLRLTPAAANQTGSAFGTARLRTASFSSAFSFRITDPAGTDPDPNGGLGADGFTFAVQPVSASLGSHGGGLGIYGISPSVAVEFDTYMNRDYGDPSSNHIGIDINGSVVSVVTADIQPSFNDGEVWYAWIDYDGAVLTVRVSDSATRPDVPQISYAVDIETTIGTDNAYVGFTSATGGGFQNQDILAWSYYDHFMPRATEDGGTPDAGAPDAASAPDAAPPSDDGATGGQNARLGQGDGGRAGGCSCALGATAPDGAMSLLAASLGLLIWRRAGRREPGKRPPPS